MDFEQELQELIDAALEAGISRDAIKAVLSERVVTLTGEEDEAVAGELDEEDDDTP